MLTSTYKSDLFFVNKDTGWICSDDGLDGGVFKTTNGGNSWARQLNESYLPKRLFFLNKDTGWVTSNNKLYRSTNGGSNWGLQYTFPQSVYDVEFRNQNLGWITSGRIFKTTNGGTNWIPSQTEVTGVKLSFASDSVGWSGVNFNIISKTLDGGTSWFYQNSPSWDNSSISSSDSLKAWAGGIGIVHTTDGGGITSISNTENTIPVKFSLNQNYPNPFNPNTVISYELRVTGFVKLKVYNIEGKQIAELVNQRQNAGEYKVEFSGTGGGSELTSGVYFYNIEINDEVSNQVFTETKRMILIR